MVKVADLIKEQNVLVVNFFSKQGAIGPTKKFGLDELLKLKIDDHKVDTNFLSTSTIRFGQDNIENVFGGTMAFILEDGEIHYAKKSDAGYTPNVTTVGYLDRNRTICKPNVINDLIEIVGPRDNEHNELLVLNPKYKGLLIWGNPKFSIKYDINYYLDFCVKNNLSFYIVFIDENERFIYIDEIKRYTDAISII